MRPLVYSLLAALCLTAPASAQEVVTPVVSAPDDAIVVQGQLDAAKKQVEALTRSITRRPRIDTPISRQYGAICLGVQGLSQEFALALIDRVEANVRDLGIRVHGPGCQVNTLISFTRDSRAEVKKLRTEHPWLFDALLDYEYDRILRGNGAVQAWQSTLVKGADGKEFSTSVSAGGGDIRINKQAFASQRVAQLRTDIVGSIVIFDNKFVPGKAIQQLADYATMRLLAPTDDLSNGSDASMATILTLFADAGETPDGLTEFDRAYLKALYRLPPTAGGSSMADAAWTAYRKAMKRDEAASEEN